MHRRVKNQMETMEMHRQMKNQMENRHRAEEPEVREVHLEDSHREWKATMQQTTIRKTQL